MPAYETYSVGNLYLLPFSVPVEMDLLYVYLGASVASGSGQCRLELYRLTDQWLNARKPGVQQVRAVPIKELGVTYDDGSASAVTSTTDLQRITGTFDRSFLLQAHYPYALGLAPLGADLLMSAPTDPVFKPGFECTDQSPGGAGAFPTEPTVFAVVRFAAFDLHSAKGASNLGQ